jgi:ABC-type polysaccharide/polyol phosphate transport system ATPase subunit
MAAVEPRTRPTAPTTAAASPDIEVRGLFKDFRIPHRQVHTIKERVLHPLAHRAYDTLHALRDVTFTVEPGEFFGVVGRNGSGKSTLLKCMAGIYGADRGGLIVRGRVSPFIELGVGFNPELAARDNVLINAVMLGLSRREARERFDAVISFAELEPFVTLKLKNYSSGMSVRLGFATAIQVDADLLLVDEVLAVGDVAFQRKCFAEFDRLKAAGHTIVFVTHDMSAVEKFCDRALLLHRGEMRELGPPGSVARHYEALNVARLDEVEVAAEPSVPPPAAAVEIVGARLEDASGAAVYSVASGDPCALCFEMVFRQPVENPVFTLALRNDAGHAVFATSSQWEETHTGSFAAGQRAKVRVALDLWLAPGRYHMMASASRAGGGADPLASSEDAAPVVVTGKREGAGVAALPHDFRIDRI